MNNNILDSKKKTKQLYVIASGVLVLYRLQELVYRLNFHEVMSFIIMILTIMGVFQILFNDTLSSKTIRLIQIGVSLSILTRITNLFMMTYRYVIEYYSSSFMSIPNLLDILAIGMYVIVLVGLISDPKNKKSLKTGMLILSIAFICMHLFLIYRDFSPLRVVFGSLNLAIISFLIYDFMWISASALLTVSLVWVFFEKRIGLRLLAYTSIWIVVTAPVMMLISGVYLHNIAEIIVYTLLLIVILRVNKEPENKRLTDNNSSPFELS